MERPEKNNMLKGVVSRTHWNTLLQKAPPELISKAKSQEDDIENKETSQGWVSLQYVLEAASISGGARALSSRLNSLSIELEASVVNPVLSARLGEDLKPFILNLLDQERELKVARTDIIQLREAVEVLLNIVKVDFQNKLSETCYHTRVKSLLNSVIFLLRVPEEIRTLCGTKTNNYANFQKISEIMESATKILFQTEFISCDGLDQIRDEITKLVEEVARQIIDILHVELFLGATDLSFLLLEFSHNDDLLLKERLTNLLSALCKLQYCSVSGNYCNNNFRQQLVSLMERCIAEARELYLRRSPVARVREEPRGYDLLSRASLLSVFPVLWKGLTEEDSRRLDVFIRVLSSAFLEVLRRFRLVKDLIVKFEDEDDYPTLSTLWLSMQQIVVVELGYLLETEYPNIEQNDTTDASRLSLDNFHPRSKGLRERFEEKITKPRIKSSILRDSDNREHLEHSHFDSSIESIHSSGKTTEGQLTSLANQTCYWLGLQPSVLWTPVVYDSIVDFQNKGEALALEQKQPLSHLVDSRRKGSISSKNNDHILFVFLEGFLKNHFCKVASEKMDNEARRLCMKKLCSRKLLDSYRIGSFRIFKCCWEAYSIIEEAHSLEVLLKESFHNTGIFNLLMAPLCSRFGDTFLRIVKALLTPFWNEQVFEWLMEHYQDKSEITLLRGPVSAIRTELSIDTLNMLNVIYNSTCFLLEPLYLKERETRSQNSTGTSEEANLWIELSRVTKICIKVFELECIHLIESSLESCKDKSQKISYCSAKFLKQKFSYFFEIANQCRGLSLLSNISGLIHDYATMLLLEDCKYVESQNEEKHLATRA